MQLIKKKIVKEFIYELYFSDMQKRYWLLKSKQLGDTTRTGNWILKTDDKDFALKKFKSVGKNAKF